MPLLRECTCTQLCFFSPRNQTRADLVRVHPVNHREWLFALVSVEALRAGMEAGEATFPGSLLRNSGLPYMDAGNSSLSS